MGEIKTLYVRRTYLWRTDIDRTSSSSSEGEKEEAKFERLAGHCLSLRAERIFRILKYSIFLVYSIKVQDIGCNVTLYCKTFSRTAKSLLICTNILRRLYA